MQLHLRSSSIKAQGFTLIEVLVSLFVLSVGLLGLAALQATSLQYNTGSYFRTQATFLAYEIIDRMRANSAAVANADGNAYDQPTTSNVSIPVDCDTSNCSSANLALYDMGKWYQRTVATLPGADASPPTIDIDSARNAIIIIRWMERDLPMEQRWTVQL